MSIKSLIAGLFLSSEIQKMADALAAMETKLQSAVSAEAVKVKADVQMEIIRAKAVLAKLKAYSETEAEKIMAEARLMEARLRAAASDIVKDAEQMVADVKKDL